jgi:hypothetical protein
MLLSRWFILYLVWSLVFISVVSVDYQNLRDENHETGRSLIANSVGRGMRKLVGSNCLRIERGTYPPNYDCIGCVIEQAQACIDDMRYNKSGNVRPQCLMDGTSQTYNPAQCCPVVAVTQKTGLDLIYLGSAYPMALQCVANVGCGDSTIYKQLLKECRSICPDKDPRSGESICVAKLGSAVSRLPGHTFLIVTFIVLFFLSF